VRRMSKKEEENASAKEIKKYLEKNFTKRVNLGKMSKEFNSNTNELTSAFKNKYGKTIVDYMIELRINNAKKLIEKNNLTINEIAKKSGYITISNFNRQFKELNGYTPAEYRKQIQNSKK
jgi:YesN/AraC family two-component response regulator